MAISDLYLYLSLHLYVFVFVFVFLLLASGGDARSGAWVTSCSLARTSTAGPWFVSKKVFVLVYLLVFPLVFPLVFLLVFLFVFLFVFVFPFLFLFRASSLARTSTAGPWSVRRQTSPNQLECQTGLAFNLHLPPAPDFEQIPTKTKSGVFFFVATLSGKNNPPVCC